MLQYLILFCVCSVDLPTVQLLPMSSDNSTHAIDDIKAGSEGYIVVAGGVTRNNAVVSRSYAYDIYAGTWSTLPNLPTTRYGGALVAHLGNIYYVSGYGRTGGLKEVMVLNTAENAWGQGPPLGIISSKGVNAVSLNTVLYAVGGNTAYLESFDCSSGKYMWRRMASAQQIHDYSGAAVLDGYIYVCGGNVKGKPTTFCEQYDPASNVWATITPMNEAREFISLVALNSYLYVIGGADANNERYDPTSKEWTYFSSVPSQKWWQSAATDGETIYVVGGQQKVAGVVNDVYAYLPETDIWQKKTPYGMEISHAGAAFVEKLP